LGGFATSVWLQTRSLSTPHGIFKAVSALNRSRHLPQCRFIVGEEDRFDIWSDSDEQNLEIVDVAVYEGNLTFYVEQEKIPFADSREMIGRSSPG
jgi:hypothetical protein